jgi:hypothetical protein
MVNGLHIHIQYTTMKVFAIASDEVRRGLCGGWWEGSIANVPCRAI